MGAVTLYTRYKYVPAPYAIYEGVMKLPAGTFLTVSTDRRPASVEALQSSVVRYWDVLEMAERSIPARSRDAEEALRSVESTLRTTVSERMVSDVPIGAFLSGGVNSSLVAAVMQGSRRPRYALSPFVSRRRNSTKPTLLPKSQVSCEPITLKSRQLHRWRSTPSEILRTCTTTIRRSVSDPDPGGIEAGPPACHGRAVGGWR